MWQRVLVRGFGLTGALLAYWIRRFSPRVRIVVLTPGLFDVHSFRLLRSALCTGLSSDALLFSRKYLSEVLLIEEDRSATPHRGDWFVEISEPSLKGCLLSERCGVEEVLSLPREEVVLPPCAASIQLALYMRQAGFKTYLAAPQGEHREALVPAELFTEKAPTAGLESICLDTRIRAWRQGSSWHLEKVFPFFDESVSSVAAVFAWIISHGRDANKVSPLWVNEAIEFEEKVLVRLGNCREATSSVKTSLKPKGWMKICLDRAERRPIGVTGEIPTERLAEAFLPLLDSSDFCSLDNLYLLAASKSPLLKNARVLELLLGAWLKLCA